MDILTGNRIDVLNKLDQITVFPIPYALDLKKQKNTYMKFEDKKLLSRNTW